MAEEISNQQIYPEQQGMVNQQTSIQQQPVQEQGMMSQNDLPKPPHVQPVIIDRLKKQETFSYKDKNGYEYKYLLQFPGVRRAYEMLDEARGDDGYTSNSKLYDLYCKEVVVEPAGLTLDDFDERPGLQELMNACDRFCGEALSD